MGWGHLRFFFPFIFLNSSLWQELTFNKHCFIIFFWFVVFVFIYLLLLTLNKHGLGLISVAHPYTEDTILLGLELSLLIKLISVPTVTFLTWTIVFSPSKLFLKCKICASVLIWNKRGQLLAQCLCGSEKKDFLTD